MGFEVRLTDIRGEPPLQVGEFLIDKDNNVLYVGSKRFDLSKNGGAEIGVIAKFIPIPPKRAFVNIHDKSNIKINVKARIIPIPSYKANINIQGNNDINIGVSCNFSNLKQANTTISIHDNKDINLKGSGNIVT